MAGGYLGKISAVISANTGDYVRGLNESAKQTQAFASTVQSTLRRASQDAAKSFQGIYTPFQQFERALRAVSRERLSFKGFEGAIRTVTDLKNRLDETLSNREIDLVVKSSGLRSIEQVKDALRSITSRDVDLAVDAGGIGGLRRLRAELESSGRDSTVLVNTEVSVKRLDALIEKFALLDDRQINAVINVLNESGLDKAIAKARQLREVADSIEGPLSAAVSRFSQLSGEVQAAFVPALGRAQTATEQLRSTIESGGNVGRRQFRALQQDVDRVTQSISRLSEAQGIVSRIGTGRGLREVNPRQFDLLNRAASATQSAAGFTGAQASGFGLGGQQGVVDREARALQRLLAVRERLVADGRDTRGIDRAIDLGTASLDRQVVVYERLIASAKEYAGTSARAAADAQRRAEASSRFLNVLQRESDILSNEGAATSSFGGRSLTDRFEAIRRDRAAREARAAADAEAQRRAEASSRFLRVDQRESALISSRGESSALTGTRDPRRRIVNELGGEVDVVRRRIDSLADPLRATIGPEVTRITNQFRSLARDGVQFTAQQVQALRGQLQAVNAALQSRARIGDDFLQGSGGAGTAGLNLGIDQRQLRSVAAEVEFLQDRLSRFSGEARGPAVQALERYRQIVASVFRSGAANTEQGRRAIADARAEVVRLTAAIDGSSVRRLGQQLQRAGDVGRGGFQNYQLAVQQAAFAVDDFFSVTGGLDQRIRAAGNNISQLGFILGSTEGLVIGIAASIGAQLITALVRWADAGRTAEDRTKALAESLSRQKTIVEELRDAFSSLGESFGEQAFSGASKEARDFEKRIEAIAKRQRELRQERTRSTDTGVLEARASVNVAQRNLERQTTVGGSVIAQRQLDEARRRLREAEQRVASAPTPGGQNVRSGVLAALENEAAERARVAAFAASQGGAAGAAEASRLEIEAGRRRAAQFEASLPLNATQDQLRDALESQIQQLIERGAPQSEVAALQSLLAQLQDPLTSASNTLARTILDGAGRVGASLDAAIQFLDDAGIGVSTLRSQIESVGLSIEQVASSLGQDGVDGARLESLRAEQTALELLAANLRQAAENVSIFAQVLERTSNQLADTVAQEARSIADQARRDANRAEAELGVGGSRNADGTRRLPGELEARAGRADDARREAEAAARQAEETRDRVRRQNDLALQLFERDALAGSGPEGTRELLLERQRLQQQIDRAEGTEEDRRAAQRRIDQINQQIARRFEDSPEGRAAAARADRADTAAQQAQERLRQEQAFQASADRGDRLRLTPAQRAAQELAQQFDDIRASFGRAAEEGSGLVDVQGQNQALVRAFEEQARGAAPAIFALADSVSNALLQGPSRQALDVTDVSSVEGARELNRLLRGDDPARDQNLLELQKQSKSLDELVRLARDNGVPVAN